MRLRAFAFAGAMMLGCAAGGARAHDSWLVPAGGGFEVVTGTRYPRIDLKPPADSILRTGPGWVELREFEVTLDDKMVEVYFREAQPSPDVRGRWQGLHADGVPWRERYRKFMRIQQGSAPHPPAGLDLELVAIGSADFKVGTKARFAALSKNVPVPGLAVELVSERSPLGIWSRTNDKGEVEWPLPLTGHWLVRTILIEPDGEAGWKSRFATLAIEVR